MKKLLLLVLILGLTSVASAAYSYNWSASQGVVGTAIVLDIDRTAHTGSWGYAFKMYDPDEGGVGDIADMTGAAFGGAQGSAPPAAISAYSATYDGYDLTAGAVSAEGTDVYAAGTMFSLTIMPSATGTLTITNYDTDYVTPIDSATITIIPEPMTIALLGLGGLFLRRRK